ALFGVLLAGVACGQEASDELLRKLAGQASVRWRDVPARQAIVRLAAETRTPVWIDRRVDTSRKVTIAAANKPVAALIDDVALSLDLGAAVIDSVVYVGPSDSAALLPALAKQWRRGAPSALRKESTLEWPRLTEPRKLAEEIASSG